MADERFDGFFLNIAQQLEGGGAPAVGGQGVGEGKICVSFYAVAHPFFFYGVFDQPRAAHHNKIMGNLVADGFVLRVPGPPH